MRSTGRPPALAAATALSLLFLVLGTGEQKSAPECESLIYCKGSLLQRIQMARIYPDSKTFVDMPTRFKEETVPIAS